MSLSLPHGAKVRIKEREPRGFSHQVSTVPTESRPITVHHTVLERFKSFSIITPPRALHF
jgi:hypothetical protein